MEIDSLQISRLEIKIEGYSSFMGWRISNKVTKYWGTAEFVPLSFRNQREAQWTKHPKIFDIWHSII